MEPTKKVVKKAYVKLIETYARNGYDISDLLNPTYKNIDAQKCLDLCNQMTEEAEGEDFWEYEEKLTLDNI